MSARPLIVCIDDDPDMLASVVRSIKSLPVEVLSTSEPQEALDWVAIRDVAVLVSDYDMPLMNGVELTGTAKLIRPETVRILLTGKRTFDAAVEGINRGEVFRYLNKPFEPAQLRATVNAAIDRHHQLAASTSERERMARRDRVHSELEAEHPGITDVAREHDGAYVVPPVAAARIAGLGLDALVSLGAKR